LSNSYWLEPKVGTLVGHFQQSHVEPDLRFVGHIGVIDLTDPLLLLASTSNSKVNWSFDVVWSQLDGDVVNLDINFARRLFDERYFEAQSIVDLGQLQMEPLQSVINLAFINILQVAFLTIVFWQKITKPNCN